MYILTILYFTGDNIAALHKICGNIMKSKLQLCTAMRTSQKLGLK